MNKIIDLPISKFIDTRFRDYAVYVLESRGIPSFYDALTPVQRYILMNTPPAYTKTLTVIGKAIGDGYHHGDMSLSKSISKLARPFGASTQILEGYGFFGTEVSPAPAAARYTSVKLSKKTTDIISEYKYLTTRVEEGPYDPLWLSIPLGLVSPIVGIAVGYKTTILPRKDTDILKFLEGKIKNLKPYFKGFNGSIKKYNNLDNSWIISSKVKVNGNRVEIRELPPIMKYTSALKKIDNIFSEYEGRIRILNNSNKTLSMDIVYRGKSSKEWKEIIERIKKSFSMIVTENPVFIKDAQVLVYSNVEEYLKDYRWQLKRLDFKNKEYEYNYLDKELLFNLAKKEFITFIITKKRTNADIDKFLIPYKGMKDRLIGLTSRKFTKDELQLTTIKIKELTAALKKKTRELKKSKTAFQKAKDPTIKKGISSKKTTKKLFDIEDIENINGITIWDGDDILEENLELIDE
jgi:DNA gyrase/topoisomerase IV subunit A